MERVGIPLYLRDKDIANIGGFSRSQVWKYTNKGILPRPVRLGSKHTAWKRDEVLPILENLETYFDQSAAPHGGYHRNKEAV